MFKRLAALMLVWALVLSLLSIPVVAQNGTGELVSRIRKEATERSQIMKTMHMFTDVYGPRLTGSPNHKAAAEWAVKQMTAWGLENAHLEPWDFKHPGWANERLSAHLISPVKDPLVCEALAWTPSTKGTVTADAVHLILPERPSQEQLTAFFASNKANVRDRVREFLGASLPGSALDDSLVLLLSAGHSHGLCQVMRQRLFLIGILPGFASVDEVEGVPVVRRAHNHGVDVFSV